MGLKIKRRPKVRVVDGSTRKRNLRTTPTLRAAAVAIVGLCSVSLGVFLLTVPGGFIVAGLLMAALGLLVDFEKSA